jgi:hypothetical protein
MPPSEGRTEEEEEAEEAEEVVETEAILYGRKKGRML